MKKIATLFIVLTSLLTLSAQTSQPVPEDLISIQSLMKTVELISSEAMAGRLPGHEGYTKAVDFMADQFGKAGLQPFGEKGYFQHLTVEYNAILSPCAFELQLDERETIFPELGKDFTFRGFTGAGDLFTEIVFAGYGISLPEAGYDDFSDIDVRDKVVMVFRGNPGWKPDGTSWPGIYPREKSAVAFKHGAAGIMFVSAPGERANMPEVIGSVMHGPGEQLADFPQLVISRELAGKILASSGHTLEMLHSTIENQRRPVSRVLNTKAKIKVRTEYMPEVQTVNIVGRIEGSDPVLKNEHVIIGAHLDHVGQQCNKIYFPGANDNASGSAAVLEIARAFSNSQSKPSRSIVFVLFASEEQGLQGAEHFVRKTLIPHDHITAMLNFDCIAHGDSIQIGNGHSSPWLWKLAKQLDAEKLMVESTWSGGGADLTPFHQSGIPGLYFVSTNSYTHLHSVNDTPETLNQELFTAITRLGFKTVWELAW